MNIFEFNNLSKYFLSKFLLKLEIIASEFSFINLYKKSKYLVSIGDSIFLY